MYKIKQYEKYKLEIQLQNTKFPFIIDMYYIIIIYFIRIIPDTPQLLLQGKSHVYIYI